MSNVSSDAVFCLYFCEWHFNIYIFVTAFVLSFVFFCPQTEHFHSDFLKSLFLKVSRQTGRVVAAPVILQHLGRHVVCRCFALFIVGRLEVNNSEDGTVMIVVLNSKRTNLHLCVARLWRHQHISCCRLQTDMFDVCRWRLSFKIKG